MSKRKKINKNNVIEGALESLVLSIFILSNDHFVPVHSESDSNSDSELNGSARKNRDTTETETDGERTPLKLGKNLPLLAAAAAAATNYSLPDCSPLNLQVIKPSGVATPSIVTGSGALTYHSSPSSSYSVGTSPGNLGKSRVEKKAPAHAFTLNMRSDVGRICL